MPAGDRLRWRPAAARMICIRTLSARWLSYRMVRGCGDDIVHADLHAIATRRTIAGTQYEDRPDARPPVYRDVGKDDSMLRLRCARRRVQPKQVPEFGLLAPGDGTEASKNTTPRSANIREGVGYSGMQRGVREYGNVLDLRLASGG